MVAKSSSFVAIKVKIRGVDKLITRMNRIIGNISYYTDETSKILMEETKKEAQNIIFNETTGMGNLVQGMKIKKHKEKNMTRWTLGFDEDFDRNDEGKPYSKFVHDGFTPHWVKISTHPSLEQWIEKNFMSSSGAEDIKQLILQRDKIFIGGPNSAPWIRNGGTKFFTRAYQKVLRNARNRYNTTIKKAIKTR